MKHYITINLFLLLVLITGLLIVFYPSNPVKTQIRRIFSPTPTPVPPTFRITSIDTMKYSRDPSLEMLDNPEFDKTIDLQMKQIAATNAKYVAIATPYDDQFLPILKRWVKAARKYHLHVWFRGNLAGWEGWFGYPRINRIEHLQKIDHFIVSNPTLFKDGDIFTPCPECENGGPGDPRQTGDVAGFRTFMIDEYALSQEDFEKIHKKVMSNFASMNYDVANLVMDKETTGLLGGIVTIDHYIRNSNDYTADINSLAQKSGGKIMIGEFGAPIPDLQGSMTPQQQATWVQDALTTLGSNPNVVGVNYWVNMGGSTHLWNDDMSPRPVVLNLTHFFAKFKP